MLRGLILLLLVTGLALLIAPFLLSSLATDEKGITIPGRVFSKSETVTVRYSDWKRSTEVTFRYEPPDTHSVGFAGVSLPPEQYDALHVGDTIGLHYLLRRDVPSVPLSNILLQMHALPILRLASRRTFSNFNDFFTPGIISALEVIAGLIILVIVLRVAGSPLFGWVLGISLVAGFGLLMLYDFPRPTPKPVVDVRQDFGRVKSLSRIDRMFEESHSRGVIANQPVDVVGIEFVPAGRSEPVVAVDLIDAGSVSGMKENSVVPIDYEANSPRTAHIRPATREFVSRNVSGMVVEGGVSLAVVIALLVAAQWIGKAFSWLLRRSNDKRPLS